MGGEVTAPAAEAEDRRDPGEPWETYAKRLERQLAELEERRPESADAIATEWEAIFDDELRDALEGTLRRCGIAPPSDVGERLIATIRSLVRRVAQKWAEGGC